MKASHHETETASILRIGGYSLILNSVLVGIKLALSLITGSLALWADGIHSLVDVFASIALILGLKISIRKSEEFPYGLYKVENIVSVAIAFLIFLTAYEIIIEALQAEMDMIQYNGWVLVVVALLIPVPYLFGQYQERIGRQYNSPSMIADGVQHKADVLSSSIVFFAVLGQFLGIPLDRIGAVIVSIFIIRSGWEILKNGMKVLLDASIDFDTLEEIRGVILEEPLVTEVTRVTGRNSGRYIFVEADVGVRLTTLERVHLVSTRIEQRIREKVPNVDRVVIHFEPQQKIIKRYAVALHDQEGIISRHFGESAYFEILDIHLRKKSVEKREIISNPFREVQKGKGIKVAEMLMNYKIDVLVAKEDLRGKGPGYAFADAGVEVIQTEFGNIGELIDDIVLALHTEEPEAL